MFQRPRSDSVDSVTGAKRAGRFSAEGIGMWTDDEHERFMTAITLYPKGPWRLVADFVGTRSARQTMTHAQKYKQKIARRQRGLRTPGRVSSRRLRQDSLTESELEAENNVMEQLEDPALRPYLPVVIRTGAQRDNALMELLTSSSLALHDATQGNSVGNDAQDDNDVLAAVADWLLDFECPPSPISPADHIAEDNDTMWIDDYLGTMLVELTDSTT